MVPSSILATQLLKNVQTGDGNTGRWLTSKTKYDASRYIRWVSFKVGCPWQPSRVIIKFILLFSNNNKTPEIYVVIFNFKFQPPPSPKKWPGTTSSRPPSHAAKMSCGPLKGAVHFARMPSQPKFPWVHLFLFSSSLLWQIFTATAILFSNWKIKRKRSTFYFTENQDLKTTWKFQKFPPPYLRMVRRHKREKGK